MSKNRFGTDFIGGLNVGTASHKIDVSELTASENGWTDEEGAWRCLPGPVSLYAGYSNIQAMAAGRMGGADHVVWFDGNTLYDNGASVGTLAVTNPVIKDFDDKFFIMGADDGKNYVYDGDHIREAGPWQPSLHNKETYFLKTTATSYTITAMALGATTTITIGANSILEGDSIYLSGITTGPTQLNGKTYTVTAVAATTVTIDAQSTGLTAWSAGGTVYHGGCGLAGDYKFYMTCIVKLADDTVIEGKPRGIRGIAKFNDSLEPETFTLAATDSFSMPFAEYWTSATYNTYVVSGTAGVDYTPGFRIYRTKAGGADFYLQSEHYYGDTDVDFDRNTSGSDVWYDVVYDSQTVTIPSDADLGAVYTPSLTDRASHPQSSVMALAAQRLWMNDLANPTRLYYSSLDGTMYVPELNYLDFPDDITAIGSAGDVVVVFSSDRMWRVSLLGGIPDVDEIKTPVGTTYGNALTLTDLGLLFLRDDGLWATDGASSPDIVTRRAFSSLTGPLGVAAYGDTLVVYGSDDLYLMRRRDGGTYWHGPAVSYSHIDATGGTFYAADANTIYKLFLGDRMGGAFETKDFVLGGESEAMRVVLDVDGSAYLTVFVNGNRVSDDIGHDEDGNQEDRRLLRFPIPRLLNHVARVRVECNPGCGVYGVWLEATK